MHENTLTYKYILKNSKAPPLQKKQSLTHEAILSPNGPIPGYKQAANNLIRYYISISFKYNPSYQHKNLRKC